MNAGGAAVAGRSTPPKYNFTLVRQAILEEALELCPPALDGR